LLDRGWLLVAGVVPDEDVAAEVAMRIVPHGIDRLKPENIRGQRRSPSFGACEVAGQVLGDG
jgi:hypothetical protein